MSGTPIKALGVEMISILTLIDPYFDEDAKQIFIKSFGLNTNLANQILRNRLGMIMYRKLKSDVLVLPEKRYFEIKIKIKDGDKFTLDSVKLKVVSYMKERTDYYLKNKKEYEKDFEECMEFLKSKFKKDPTFLTYLKILEKVKKVGYSREISEDIRWMNVYEKNELRTSLPNNLKKKFDNSKSVVKYVRLKIMGEVIGGLLNKLRSEMFSEMIKNSPIYKIIDESEKKTILFTTFVDVAKNAYEYTKIKYKPVIVFGETSGSVKSILDGFKTNPKINPLIATIQTLSTGVTLVEANTVIFLNQPWRHTDKLQAEDRVHRIGQDTDVNIFTFVLDTNEKPNLSTRMEDIISWSKDMFLEIVGDERKD
jgi:SNF2 family DNA or RNA helicase